MKKLLFRVAISTATFFVGLGIFVLVFNSAPEVAAPSLLPKDCAESKTFPGLSKKLSEIKKGKSGYFPKNKFSGKWEKRDDFINDWYGNNLKAMNEKPLLDVVDDAEIYRFLWLRTFHHPIFVKVVSYQGEIKLFTKELDGAGGYEPGKIIRNNEFALKQEDLCEFLSLLEKADYWNLPINKDNSGIDGAKWILEGVKNGRYHAVDRFSPEKGEYREACIYLLKLSGIDTDRLKGDLY
jgi:hypothetical protein